MSTVRTAYRYVWATVAIAGLGVAWYAAHLTIGAGTGAVAYIFVPVGAALCAASVLHMARKVTLDRLAWRFWRAILVAFALVTIGYAWLAVDMLTHPAQVEVRSMPIPAAACAATGFGVALWALARVPIGTTDGVEWWRIALDRTIAFLGCATVLWYFGLAPMFSAPEPWSRQAMTLVGLAFLLTVAAVTKVAYLVDSPVDRSAIRLIALGGGFTAAADAVISVRFGYAGGVPAQAVVMPLTPVLATLGVLAQWRASRTRRRLGRRGNTLLPYLAVAAVGVPLVAVAFGGPLDWPGRYVVIAAVVVTTLVAVRQYLGFRDNARLLREMQAQEARLQHEATHDSLTGLANRTLFHDRLAAALAATGPVAVLLIDLDDFKTVNDLLGHNVGDCLLRSVAVMLQAEAGDGALPARVGGDEFAVLLTRGDTEPETLARRILVALDQPLSEHRLLVQASIGVAEAQPGATLHSVLRNADVAMYIAKRRGKAGCVRFVEGMDEPVLAHMQLGGELHRALDDHEFRVVYQPIVRLADRRVVGVEALVRWHHPIRGIVSPAEFIPAAEQTGLIVPLGRFVLHETCRQAAQWLREYGTDALQRAGLNVSGQQLHDPDFVTDVATALADSGLPTDRLVLEVTESAALRGQQISRTLYELDGMGIQLALDDFGTGESSLSLLRAFPAAIVKLDRSFVEGIEIDDGDPAAADARRAVARAVIQLVRSLALEAVAEGVENAEQALVLRNLGYTLGQGYHLAQPMTADGMARLLAGQQSMTAVDR
jgi:diguanylate cyclase (GGDEF)-like protein